MKSPKESLLPGIGKKIVAVWISLTCVIIVTAYLFSFQEKLRVDLDLVLQISRTLSMVYDLENQLAEAESAARGYILTGDEAQLERYQQAAREIDRSFDELYLFTAAEVKARRLLDTLKPKIKQRQALFQRSIDLARQRGMDAREYQGAAQEGSKVQGQIRRSLEKLEEEQKGQMNPEWVQARRKARIILSGLTGGVFASFSLLFLVIFFLNREISGRKRAENQVAVYQENLRSMASQLTLAEERERRRLAVNLHDRIGHNLALINIRLGELQKQAPGRFPGLPVAELAKIGTMVEQTIRDTRSLTFQISSPILYELGLEAALESLTDQIQQEHGISCRFVSDGRPRYLDDDVRVLLFQAARELLVNVVKHAQSRNLKVSVQQVEGNLKVQVSDDGKGFQWGRLAVPPKGKGGFGLFSISERLRPFGGLLQVQSAPGAGASITLTVPLKDHEH